jgi:hypothetical protein
MERRYLVALIVVSVLTCLSLALNGVVIFGSLKLRQTARGVVGDAQTLLAEMSNDTLSYTVELDQEIPISADVPFNEVLSVPVNTVVPISTTVRVPVDLGFTTYRLTVPIETIVPVDLEATVPVSQVVDVTTIVPLQIAVPIEIHIPETALADYLRDAEVMLERLEQQLEPPVWQR